MNVLQADEHDACAELPLIRRGLNASAQTFRRTLRPLDISSFKSAFTR